MALDHVNLQVQPGKVVGLLGPNGSGKTTIIKLINGLLQPTEGEVLINGSKPDQHTKAIVSYLPDTTYLDEQIKVRQAISYFADFYKDFDANRAYYLLQNLNINPDSRMRELSKGNREKVQLILVMSRRAQLYILDEPIGGVDPATRDYILQTIINNYSPNSTVLISTHLIADVEQVLDEVIFIQYGHITRHENAAALRAQSGLSIDQLFRHEFSAGGY
ncbi:ABC transporter ATP-binding protein [Streptococcus sp. DD13]|uniref:ABC transporter ATP-binding protein n=1 Tax=Streptococcus sp. DD13 TaxID=1777881 RepID=UPI000833653C|nr:ABC transporter ATP-binding protein [Streptococcus sp. DD13]